MSAGRPYRGRFAPSPTGDLHLGSAAAALVAWLDARAAGGALVVRVEDLDPPRTVPGAADRQMDDLRWLGLDWDEGPDVGGPHTPYVQSARGVRYEGALAALAGRGLTYLCDCSRAEIARVASAPHAGDEGPRYPGTCRALGMAPRPFRRAPAVRFAVPADAEIALDDRWQGRHVERVADQAGDFVLRRGDGVFAYQLAVVVDDLAMEITDVVRGADLLGSSARQALLARALGGEAPRFAHLPLVLASDGARLAKRAGSPSIRGRREAGERSPSVVASIARVLGLVDASVRQATPRELLAAWNPSRLVGVASVRAP